MDRQIISFKANEQRLVKNEKVSRYSSNKVAYIGAHFDLGANWDGFDSVRAVWFTDRINGISTVLDGEGNCTVPTEVLKKKDRVFVNLVGSIVSNGELTDRLTTYPAVALVVDSKAKVDSTETAPVTPSQFEQFVSIVQDAVANIKDIVSTTLNADYTLTFVYSDGTSYTTPSIRGERGPQGADGADGTDGNGIASAVLNSNYTLTLTFTDGTSYTTPSIRGAQGPKGDPGDVSQAQLDAAVSDLKSVVDIATPSCNIISGKYIAANGSIQTSSSFAYSEPIPVNKGAIVTLIGRGYLDNVAMISLCDSAGSYYLPVVVSPDSDVHTYKYTCEADGYIAISYATAVTPILNIGGENSNSVIAPKVRELVAFTGEKDAESNASPQIYSADHYITKAGVNTSNSSFNVYGVISLNRGDTISVYAKGYLDNVGIISKVQNGVFTVVVASPDSTERTYTYTADSNCDVVISSNKSTTVTYTVDRKTIPESLDELYSNLPDFQPELCSLSLFEKFGVVGDSFASGELYFDSSYHDKYNISWGQIMARKHGTTCTNYSSGGQTTRSWLTATKGLPLLLSSEAENIYYLALGINDYYSLGQSYLGTIADITNDYTQNPDTFYGNYARIIEQIQEHAPHAKMVMFTVANTDTVPQMFSDAIIEIAEHYNIPYIVQADDSFFHSEIYTNMVGSHPTAIAHSGMAEAFERLLKKCIVNNRTYFADYMMY